MHRLGFLVLALAVLFTAGCATSAARLPASFKSEYNKKIVASLSTAAANHVLFNIDDAVFRVVSARQIDQCRTRELPTWSSSFLEFLALMDKKPEYYDKFNMVEFKRGGNDPSVEINKDIDGLSSLIISFGVREKFEKVTAKTKMPCSESPNDYLDKEIATISVAWPSTAEISEVLLHAPAKLDMERFQFNTDFLIFLAERQAILKINPEVAFERNYDGQYFLANWLSDMSKQLKDPTLSNDYIRYWFGEISTRSAQAKNIQFFGLHADSNASVGVKVDTAGKLQRKINNYQEPSYLFMSYRQQNGGYIFGTLKDLNACLQGLTGIYRNPLSMKSALERDPASFLGDGHSCNLRDND